ncbi:hypothetical protein AKJ47_00035 [candidate division MSBL1 archaeon SCGC-AAA261G05]|uniref:Metalloprotease n=3 Tax=candidate division MSBL1 TaxID=215777 RepID=A0A133UZF3_9EURY|nr:hypothetical protein AKJ42_03000 [candidate division MSBL1 archaeon SCGC-AAA261C02]KXB04235.1 hypothetical protein AKJ47_00035 [candidate division MSBL1 archaeon SCGC-AAA261G05]KXB05098.1 hypothetical protein AKJ48_00060 [candidate division MSBL1 archaeon SCGC-AAA261O19]
MLRFTRSELSHIAISILVLTIAVSGIGPNWPGLTAIGRNIAAVSLPLVAGFFAHEISHKYTAIRYGYWSVYRMWPLGLLIALIFGIISSGRVLFAAPGAVMILTPHITRKENGLISLAGPLANIVVAIAFYPLTYVGGLVGLMGSFGVFVNLWLAFFNLLPIGPLDGSKLIQWNPMVWIGLEVVLAASLFTIPF